MFKTKSLVVLLLVLTVLFAQAGTVFAAPALQETTPIVGTIVDITQQTDANGVTTVLVTVKDAMGETQTVRLSVETAVALGLASVDSTTNAVTLDLTKKDQPIEIDPTTVIVDEEETDGDVHPIASILASFFGTDAATVDQYHEDGFGFGVIAQAMWISRNVNGDASITGLILEAKESGNYGNIMLSDGTLLTLPDGSVPQNWGQFKKALLDKKNNLGVIVSGQAGDSVDDAALQENGNGKDKDKKDKNKKDKGNNGNGQGNNNKP